MKYRKALLDEAVTTIIQETAAEIAERFPIEMAAIGTDKNHLHLRCSAHPKVAPGRIVQMFKSITAREIFRGQPAGYYAVACVAQFPSGLLFRF